MTAAAALVLLLAATNAQRAVLHDLAAKSSVAAADQTVAVAATYARAAAAAARAVKEIPAATQRNPVALGVYVHRTATLAAAAVAERPLCCCPPRLKTFLPSMICTACQKPWAPRIAHATGCGEPRIRHQRCPIAPHATLELARRTEIDQSQSFRLWCRAIRQD